MSFQVLVERSGEIGPVVTKPINSEQLSPEMRTHFEALLAEVGPGESAEEIHHELYDQGYDSVVYTILLVDDTGRSCLVGFSDDVLEVGRTYGAFIDGIDFGERSGHSMYRDGKYFDMPPHREPAKKPKFKGAGRSES